MRVLLIRPGSGWPANYVPIGLGYIADVVRRSGHDVLILDARLLKLSPAEVMHRVRDFSPDVIGISAVHVCFDIEGTRELTSVLKKEVEGVPLVLGGPLVSTMGEEFVRDGLVDAAVIGEGEGPFCAYLDMLGGVGTIDDISGLIYRQNDAVKSNPPGHYLDAPDIGIPAWDLIRPKQYFKALGRSGMSIIKHSRRSVPIFTSRGCPFGCIYCHNIFGKKFRPRSPEAVLDEISMLVHEYGVRELEIVDDCFNLDLERAKKIAGGIVDRGWKVSLLFPNALRADRMDEELVDMLKAAGAYQIRYAVETASPRLQKSIHKNLDLERTREIIDYTADQGIFTLGFFMLGFPTETEEEMRMTVKYALDSKLHAAMFFYVNPFPGTELAQNCGVTVQRNREIDNMSYTDLRVNLSEVPDKVLRRICKRAFRRFYFSPRRMWRIFRVTPKNLRTIIALIVAVIYSTRDTQDW